MTADGRHPPCARAPRAPTVPARFPAGSPTASSSPSERYSSSLFGKILLWPPESSSGPCLSLSLQNKTSSKSLLRSQSLSLTAQPPARASAHPHTNTAPLEAPLAFLSIIPEPISDPHAPATLHHSQFCHFPVLWRWVPRQTCSLQSALVA